LPQKLKPASALPSTSQRNYVDITIATGRGIRTVAVREDRLGRYGRLDYKNRAVYAKKRTVQTKSGKYVRKAIDPRRLRRNYTYDDKARRYKKYEAKKLVRVRTARGEVVMTEEQKKYTYAKKGAVYERTQAYRRRVRHYEVKGDMVPPGYQAIVYFEVIDAEGKTRTYQTFSHVSGGRLSKAEARHQASYMLFAKMREDGIITSYDPTEWDERITVNATDEDYIKYVV